MTTASSAKRNGSDPISRIRSYGLKWKSSLKRLGRKYNIFDRRQEKEVLLDVVGSCNLRCPSCPVGHAPKVNPTGLIDKSLFADLIRKADREYKVNGVSLFNWAEPMLHPELPELVRIVKSRGLRCYLSSNLSILRDSFDEILMAGADGFRVSISGFTQPVYSKAHVGGSIDRVKENMRKLSEAKKRVKSGTKIHAYYHKYQYNLHELPLMKDYAKSLGFQWQDGWAYFMGLEKIINHLESSPESPELDFADRQFALPIRECLEATTPYRHQPCSLLKNQLVFDLKGNLMPCCTVYDYRQNSLGNFLEMSPGDVAAAKRSASACKSCASHGIHIYATYFEHPQLRDVYEDLANKNVAASLIQLNTKLPAA